jgi:hypothetical protein
MLILSLFCLVAIDVCQAEAEPEPCTKQISLLELAGGQPLANVAAEASRLLHISVVAEIEVRTEIDVPSSSTNIDELLSSASSGLYCSSVDKVVHIVSSKVANLEGNLLNYKFRYFEIPSDVDHFRISLRARLDDEGFAHGGDRQLIKPGSGYIAFDASSFPLQPEKLHEITARDLILRVASQQIITFVIEFPQVESNERPQNVWRRAEQHWVIDRSPR